MKILHFWHPMCMFENEDQRAAWRSRLLLLVLLLRCRGEANDGHKGGHSATQYHKRSPDRQEHGGSVLRLYHGNKAIIAYGLL